MLSSLVSNLYFCDCSWSLDDGFLSFETLLLKDWCEFWNERVTREHTVLAVLCIMVLWRWVSTWFDVLATIRSL